MKPAVTLTIVVILAATAALGCYEEGYSSGGTYYTGGYDYYDGGYDYTPDPPPDYTPDPPPSYEPYDRYDVSFVISALAFDWETDEIIGDVEILYAVNDGPFESLGFSDYDPWYTDPYGDLPDRLVNFGDPVYGPMINIGDMWEDEVIYLTLVAEDPLYGEYYARYIDLEIVNTPDGVVIYSSGAEIEIETIEADYVDPIFPVRALFDIEWIY